VIDGANDAAVVSGDTSGSVVESGTHGVAQLSGTTSGHLISNDVDNDANFQFGSGTTQHGYGTYEINASGDWTFTLNNADHTVQALNDGDTLTETFTVHTTDGTDQVVSIVINGANEIYNGTNNADVIRGDAYGDTMTGFAGNDTYFVNNTADKVVELSNDGYDTVQATVSYTLSDNVEALLLGGHLDINGTGNGGDNAIAGNAGANVLSGLGGDDSLSGGNGNDTLNGGDGDDLMNGGVGNDTASYAGATAGVAVSLAITSYQDTGGAGFDKLVSIENLTGSSFADTLTGNTGNNIITGGGGADVLTGGVGHDVFVYTAASDSAVGSSDTITDLTNADSIDLSALGSDFTIVSSFTGHADQITLHFDGVHTTISIDLDGNGSADMAILVNGDHHTFHDFIGLGQ
jgi:VCBS repeat-containing protein